MHLSILYHSSIKHLTKWKNYFNSRLPGSTLLKFSPVLSGFNAAHFKSFLKTLLTASKYP
jgi:hypothetical protein